MALYPPANPFMENQTLRTADDMGTLANQHALAAEMQHLTRQIQALQRNRPDVHFGVYTLPGSGSLRITAPSRFGPKLNHVVGFGMNGPVTSASLREVEAVDCGKVGTLDSDNTEGGPRPLRFHVCERAHPSAFHVLREAGYFSVGNIVTLACWIDGREEGDMGNSNAAAECGDVCVERYEPGEDIEGFVAASVEGFRSGGCPPELLAALAESAALREDTVRFRALVGGKLAGTAGMTVLDVGVRVANLYIDSTFPEFRGMGVQRALLLARIAAAKAVGCQLVMASAWAGSGSARNIERAGLEALFLSEGFTKSKEMKA